MMGFANTANRVHIAITGDNRDFDKSLTDAEKKAAESAKRMKAAMAIVAGAAIAGLVQATQAAEALGESQNAVNKVFGESTDIIDNFGDVSAQAAGLSKRAFNELAVLTGSLLQGMGFDARAAAEETTKLALRASDMASVFNTDVAVAMDAINAALRGETEQIRQFGVTLSDAEIRARAVAMGLAETTAQVDKNDKAVAALDLIYEQTANTVGDFIETSDEAANAQRRAAAEAENAAARLGQALLQPKAALSNFAADVLLSFQALLNLNNAQDDVAEASLRVTEAMDHIREKAVTGKDTTGAFADSLFHLAEAGILNRQQMMALAAAAGITLDEVDGLTWGIIEQARAQGRSEEVIAAVANALGFVYGPQVEEVTEDVEDHAEAERDAAAAIERSRDALLAKADALRSINDPLFKIIRRSQDLKEAEDKINEATKEYGKDSDEFVAATLDRADIIADLMDTLADLREDGINPTGEAAREMLEGLELPPEVIDRIFRQFDEIEANLGRRDLVLDVYARTHFGGGTSRDSGERGFGGGFHTGGLVNAPRGQETMILAQGGERVVNDDLYQTSSERGGGDVFNFNVTVKSDNAEAFIRDMERIARRRRAEVVGGF